MLNIYYSMNEIRLNPEFVLNRFSGRIAFKDFFLRIMAFFYRGFRSFLLIGNDLKTLRASFPMLLFFSSTENQYDSVLDLKNLFDNAEHLTHNLKNKEGYKFPLFFAFFVALLLLPLSIIFCIHFIFTDKNKLSHKLKILSHSLDEIFMTPGYFVLSLFILKNNNIGIFITANDHNSINRAFCLASKKLNKVSIYIQHAAVSSIFPSLLFDFALLDGKHSYDIYNEKNQYTKLILTGSSRHDQIVEFDKSKRDEKFISVAINKLDNLEFILKNYVIPLTNEGYKVFIRPHPGFKNSELVLFSGYEVVRGNIFEHLATMTYLIAGDSSIHLDAFMMGVYPIYSEDFSGLSDYYGFKQKSAVFSTDSKSIIGLMKKFEKSSLLETRFEGMLYYNEGLQHPTKRVSSIQERTIREVIAEI